MGNETVTKSSRFYCVSLVPDICKTPVGASTPPIPYNVIGEFSDANNASRNVRANNEQVFLRGKSRIPAVKGDNPGKAGGVKSGTVAKEVEGKTSSSTLRANGMQTTQVGRTVWMNAKNTVGTIYERAGKAARERLVKLARSYKESDLSEALHEFGEGAMDKGGKVVMASGAVAVGGAAVAATGVGLPVAAVMETGAAAGGTVGGAVTAAGAGADSVATLLDEASDAILSGRSIDLAGVAKTIAVRVATNVIAKKTGGITSLSKRQASQSSGSGSQSKPGTKQDERPKTSESGTKQRADGDGSDGGKTKGKEKGKKGDKPSDCCPKNSAPGGKPVSTRKPVHLGTGEEVLYQTDFEIAGAIPIVWTRCYRSASECEDWGLLGARWGTPFTSSIAVTEGGIVFVDDTGRPILLRSLGTGETLDNRKEGFTLSRTRAEQFLLTWRDGSTDTYVRYPSSDSWLPHGHQGVNAMHHPGQPVRAERFVLTRSADRGGRGITIEHLSEAQENEPLLRITTDEGLVLEAICAISAPSSGRRSGDVQREPRRIDRIEEVRADGTRVCHVRYRYERATAPLEDSVDPFDHLPPRFNLVAQANISGSERTYTYCQQLLTACTTYTDFAYTLEWISLGALRARWAGCTLSHSELVSTFPVTLHNSYQARVIATDAADGLDSVRIDYVSDDRTRVTEANGGVLEYVFDDNWLAVEVLRLGGHKPVSLGRREWDGDGMLLAEINGASQKTCFTYDAVGNLLTTTDPLGRETRFEYDAHNQPVAITDAAGNVTRLEYDENGQLTAQTNALGNTTRYRYDSKQRLVGMQDAKGGKKEIGYDRAGRIASSTDCSGYRTLYRYDENSRLSTILDALEQPTRYEYNGVGWLTCTVLADESSEQFEYDADGRMVTHKDAAGHETRYRYNGHGLMVERIDALGYSVQYRYDEMLRLTELINQNGESYYFSYDAEGRLLTETGLDGLVITYGYDQAGHLTTVECGGKKTELQRDLVGRLLVKVTEDGGVRFNYDELDRLTVAVAPNAWNKFRYDAVGHLLEESCAYYLTPSDNNTVGPRKPDATFTIAHKYDELGDRIQTVLPTGERVDILRYGSGHWHGTLFNGETIVDIERDRLHREKLRQYGADHAITFTRDYDARSRVVRITINRKGHLASHGLFERQMKYDVVGNLLQVDQRRSENPDSVEVWKHNYDPLGQILATVKPELTERFLFDPAGNMIDSSSLLESSIGLGGTSRYQSARQNRLLRYQNHAYQYDDAGNVTTRSYQTQSGESHLSLEYDCQNRLIRALNESAHYLYEAAYFYDAFSRRIAKKVVEIGRASVGSSRNDQRVLWKVFVWSDDVLTHDITDTQSITYLGEPGSFTPMAQVTRQAGENSNENLEFCFCDSIGTPEEMFRADGTITWVRSHKTWGDTSTAQSGLNESHPIRFPGQYHDAETGLFYNRYRYYDPVAARFVTQDPIGLYGGLNTYAYVPSPQRWADPLGLAAAKGGCDPCCGRDLPREAMATQGAGDYPGVDTYTQYRLKRGTILYSLHPGGAPGFAVSIHTLRKAEGSSQKYHELTQVVPGTDPLTGRPRSRRTQVRVYRVTEDICVAKGVALAQPLVTHGRGGATQYFVSPMDISKLSAGRIRTI